MRWATHQSGVRLPVPERFLVLLSRMNNRCFFLSPFFPFFRFSLLGLGIHNNRQWRAGLLSASRFFYTPTRYLATDTPTPLIINAWQSCKKYTKSLIDRLGRYLVTHTDWRTFFPSPDTWDPCFSYPWIASLHPKAAEKRNPSRVTDTRVRLITLVLLNNDSHYHLLLPEAEHPLLPGKSSSYSSSSNTIAASPAASTAVISLARAVVAHVHAICRKCWGSLCQPRANIPLPRSRYRPTNNLEGK